MIKKRKTLPYNPNHPECAIFFVDRRSFTNGWPSQFCPPSKVVVVAAVAAAVVDDVAADGGGLATTKQINVQHKAALLICLQFFGPILFSPHFSHVLPRPELVQQQQHLQRKNLEQRFFCDIFARHFLARQQSICPLHFFVLCVHGTQVLLSNFIKKPFCYFSNSGSMSNAQIIEIICMNSQKGLLKQIDL